MKKKNPVFTNDLLEKKILKINEGMEIVFIEYVITLKGKYENEIKSQNIKICWKAFNKMTNLEIPKDL